jgi:hypothetical protein
LCRNCANLLSPAITYGRAAPQGAIEPFQYKAGCDEGANVLLSTGAAATLRNTRVDLPSAAVSSNRRRLRERRDPMPLRMNSDNPLEAYSRQSACCER